MSYRYCAYLTIVLYILCTVLLGLLVCGCLPRDFFGVCVMLVVVFVCIDDQVSEVIQSALNKFCMSPMF